MARRAFIASVALHSGLVALICCVTFRDRTSCGPAESGLKWSADSDAAGELVAADPSDAGDASEIVERMRERRGASAPPATISLTVVQTVAPLTVTASFSVASQLSVAVPPSFAPDGVRDAKADAVRGAVKKSFAKGNGTRNRDCAGGGQAYTPARYAVCPPPVFPSEARKARLSGTALLFVQIDARGRPLNVTLRRSSGHAILDTAALRAVRGWRFEPARRDGKPVEARLEIPVRFALS